MSVTNLLDFPGRAFVWNFLLVSQSLCAVYRDLSSHLQGLMVILAFQCRKYVVLGLMKAANFLISYETLSSSIGPVCLAS